MLRTIPLCLLLSILLISTQPGFAQDDLVITPENATQLTVMAELPLLEGVGDFVSNGNSDVAWSADGTKIGVATGSVAHIYDLVEPNTSPLRYEQLVPDAPDGCGSDVARVRDIAFSDAQPDLAAISTNTQVSVVSTETQETIATLEQFANEIVFDDQGRLAILTENGLNVWDYEASAIREFVSDGYFGDGSMTRTAGGTSLALMDHLGYVTVQNPSSGQIVDQYEPPTCDESLAGGGCGYLPDIDVLSYASDGQILLSRGHFICQQSDTFNAYSTITGARIYEITGEPIHVDGSPAADLVAVITSVQEGNEPTRTTGVQLVQSFTGESVATLAHDDVRAMAFSPSGDRLATISNTYARIWTLPAALPTREEVLGYSQSVVDAVCDGTQSLAVGQTVSIGWSWFAQTQDQLQDHIVNAHYSPTINELRVNRWMFLTRPQQAPEFNNDWTVYYYVPIGNEPPGQQMISNELYWDTTISDGYDSYGPGTGTERITTSCAYQVR